MKGEKLFDRIIVSATSASEASAQTLSMYQHVEGVVVASVEKQQVGIVWWILQLRRSEEIRARRATFAAEWVRL